MLSRVNRIKKKKDFEFIFKNSKSFKNSLFILKIAKNNLDISRFGFVISKKISNKAIIRNKIRRRVSDIAKEIISDVEKGKDLVLIALSGIEKKEFFEIKEAMVNILVRSKIINK